MKKRLLILIISMFLTGCSNAQNNTEDSYTSSSETSESAGYSYTETEMVINPGEFELPATLTVPDGEEDFPLVIFVSGSGPADRNETVGKQTLFKDLAEDLAKLGVATLRYDKRTYVYAEKSAADVYFTVKDEAVDDVIGAVSQMSNYDGVNPKKIYIAGHSMGGYLIPKIDESDTDNLIAGYISLAGSMRPLMELMLEQIDYILSLEHTLTALQKAQYKTEYIEADMQIKALTENDKGSNKAVMGAYPAYWLDLAEYNPAEAVKNIKEPVLVLQGGHDYQVTIKDYEIWQSALGDNDKAKFILYPYLTHMFTYTSAMSKPKDYNISARADGQVSEDIKKFLS